MKYMLLAYTNASSWDEQDISSEEVQAICEFYIDFERELTESGEWVGSEGLADPSHLKTIRRSVTGPSSPMVPSSTPRRPW